MTKPLNKILYAEDEIDIQKVATIALTQLGNYQIKTVNSGKEVFDVILSIEVMEHVKYPKRFLKKLISLISKKGTALLSVPSKDIMIFPYIFQSYVHKKWGHDYRRGFNYSELKNMLDENIKDKRYKIIEWKQIKAGP